MTATQTPPQAAEQAVKQVARTLDAIRRHRHLSDQQLADRSGLSRPQVEARRNGRTPCSVSDLAKLAIALNVETATFLLERDEAVRWVLDNRPTFMTRSAEGKAQPGGEEGDTPDGTGERFTKPGNTTRSNRTGPMRNRGRTRKSVPMPAKAAA